MNSLYGIEVKDRISALGFHRKGREFMEAAFSVKAPTEKNPFLDSAPFTAYYLLGHSLELLLKSFLIGRGTKISELRSRKYGHDLEKLLRESKRRKIGRELKFESLDGPLIQFLNLSYKPKLLEYYAQGMYEFPRYTLIAGVVKRTCDGLYPYARRISDRELEKKRKIK